MNSEPSVAKEEYPDINDDFKFSDSAENTSKEDADKAYKINYDEDKVNDNRQDARYDEGKKNNNIANHDNRNRIKFFMELEEIGKLDKNNHHNETVIGNKDKINDEEIRNKDAEDKSE